MYTILGLLIPSIVNEVIIFSFCDVVYRRIYKKKIYVIAYLCFVCLDVAIGMIGIPLIATSKTAVLIIILSKFFYDNYKKSVVVYTVLLTIYLVFLDIITVPIYAFITASTINQVVISPYEFFMTGMINSLLAISTYRSLIFIISKHKIGAMEKNQIIFMILLGVFEFTVIYYIIRSIEEKEAGIIVSCMAVGFLCLNAYLVFLFENIYKNNELRLRYSLLEQQEKMTFKYYENMQANYEKSRQFLHDIKQHLRVLRKTEGIDKEYYEEIDSSMKKLGYQFKCSNEILNIIINDKLLICSNKKINLELDIDDIDLLFMKKMDITIVFGNILDNAIEAVEGLDIEKREIKFKVKSVQNCIVIHCENNCISSVKFAPKVGGSEKRGHMGLGLSNVIACGDKYGGNVKLERSNNIFHAKIIIPILF